MGEYEGIGVSTGDASAAAGDAAALGDQYEVIDLDFRAVVAGVSDAVVELVVARGALAFGEALMDDFVRLRARMHHIGHSAADAGRAAAETDRANAERFERRAI